MRLRGGEVARIKKLAPTREGRSKKIWRIDDDRCVVELKPTLHSFTFAKDDTILGTEVLRLSFYARICQLLSMANISHAFQYQADERTYVSLYGEEPPIEVIVKNYAVGSTLALYPGLFHPGKKFSTPVVKFDFRVEPQDLPLPDDYVRELGLPVDHFRETALRVNDALVHALPGFTVVDFCLVYGLTRDGTWRITSELSPDSMRIRDAAGCSYDKDLFRLGEPEDLLRSRWQHLIDEICNAK